MDLDELTRHLNAFGERDAFWAILTDPAKINHQWSAKDFFATGEQELAQVLLHVTSLGVSLATGRALDFGCGAGRITQSLCKYFDESTGVDIAPSMIDLAWKHNAFGSRCHYVLNQRDDLSLFTDASFDFIYSGRVLQHMKPEYIQKYLVELMRVLAPQGVLVFQLPHEHVSQLSSDLTSAKQRSAAKPLPESGFIAAISLREPIVVAPNGYKSTVKVWVRNRSTVAWPVLDGTQGYYRIGLGNHWLDGSGHLLVRDDVRTYLPTELRPNEELPLDITVTLPARPGKYILVLDMVQEGVAWFQSKGSSPARFPIELRFAAENRPINDAAGFVPRMEMHGLRQESVLATIMDCHGRVLDIEPEYSAGSEWASFMYYATKSS